MDILFQLTLVLFLLGLVLVILLNLWVSISVKVHKILQESIKSVNFVSETVIHFMIPPGISCILLVAHFDCHIYACQNHETTASA